jgi:hypothetical protein
VKPSSQRELRERIFEFAAALIDSFKGRPYEQGRPTILPRVNSISICTSSSNHRTINFKVRGYGQAYSLIFEFLTDRIRLTIRKFSDNERLSSSELIYRDYILYGCYAVRTSDFVKSFIGVLNFCELHEILELIDESRVDQ